LLFAVNPDVPKLAVIDTSQPLQASVVTTLDVGQSPTRVLVGPGDTIYVANRGSRSVSIFNRGQKNSISLSGTINTGAEPTGLGLSADGRRLFVACSAQGSVQAFDLGSGGKATVAWESQLGDLPRTLAVLPDGRLYVGHLLTASVDVLDPATGAVQKTLSTAVGVDPTLTVFDGPPGGTPVTFRPTGLESIVVSSDGSRAYLFHRRDRNQLILTDGTTPQAIPTTPVVTPAITTIELGGDNVLDETLTSRRDFPPAVVFPDNRMGGGGGDPVPQPGPALGSGTSNASYGGGVTVVGVDGAGWTQGPSAAVEDPQGNFLYVASRNTDNVIILPTNRRTGTDAPGGIIHVVSVSAGPSGLALSPDGRTLFVHNQLDDSISVLEGTPAVEVQHISAVSGAAQAPTDVIAGRKLFFSAADSSMTRSGQGLACESCHIEGSHDGNVWQFTQGPRKTPSLLARRIQQTQPYHWDGTLANIHDFFVETVQVRMGGSGLLASQESQLGAYMQQLGPIDNPNLQAGGGLTASQQRGKDLFNGQAQCSTCHTGPLFTDNAFHDVGTRVSNNPLGNPDDPCLLNPTLGSCQEKTANGAPVTANPQNTAHGFNTPSLLGVAWAAPYLHDGRAATLQDRLNPQNNPGDLHGKTSGLTSDQLDDLVAYLKTL
jgi:DNA-binding beta-propeller fold protein YncE